MLRSLNDLRDYTIRATDREIGKVHDFYFDDSLWTIRYLVVDTGNWLSGRRVLLSPLALEQPDWNNQSIPVKLTGKQVELSPHIDTEKPVSRQMEEDLYKHFNWQPYWRAGTPLMTGAVVSAHMVVARQDRSEKSAGEREGDPHLRSMIEVLGYNIQARDGEIGHVEDFIIEDDVWSIYYMIVDTHNWLPGKKVLVSLQWIEDVSWAERAVSVDLQRETIKGCPEFDPSTPVNRAYELVLYDYYGKPRYWMKTK
ncbi:MAG: PRC-barrel domain-containing protein [Anaerolineae bacterium]|nr:PRC-barrel domain-containing protein [Anaerolineae bacterium]